MTVSFGKPTWYVPVVGDTTIFGIISSCKFSVAVMLDKPKRKDSFDWERCIDYYNSSVPLMKGFYTPYTKSVIETGVCALDIKESKLDWMTLSERLLLEQMYFAQEGRHLDTGGSVTVCAGSRFKGGDVPIVYADPKGTGICIGAIDPASCIGNSGPRQVWRT